MASCPGGMAASLAREHFAAVPLAAAVGVFSGVNAEYHWRPPRVLMETPTTESMIMNCRDIYY